MLPGAPEVLRASVRPDGGEQFPDLAFPDARGVHADGGFHVGQREFQHDPFNGLPGPGQLVRGKAHDLGAQGGQGFQDGLGVAAGARIHAGDLFILVVGCVNCRKMELAVWTDPKVSDIINNDYVLITLYVDNKTPLSSPVKIMENGTERTLRTVGDKWSYLQRVKFGANAQPFYVLIDNEGKPLNKSYSYDESIPKYIEFLQTGLENYKKEK